MNSSLFQYLNNPDYLLYIGFFLILLELFLGVDTGFDLLVIGLNLIIGAVLQYILKFDYLGIGSFIILSFLYVFFGRKVIKEKLNLATTKTNIDSLIGKTGIVVKKIHKASAGRVKVSSEEWRAEADEDIEQGEKVKVIEIEGVTLKVKKI